MSRCANPTIYAFEPAPVVYELLKANCEAYGSNVRASERRRVGPAQDRDVHVLREVVGLLQLSCGRGRGSRRRFKRSCGTCWQSDLGRRDESVEEYVDELTADRLRHSDPRMPADVACRTSSGRTGIDRIDLLKIDAEKSELDIIAGIEDDDWPKIDQIVIEIHDRTGEAVDAESKSCSSTRGSAARSSRKRCSSDSGLFNLYATRDRAAGEARPPRAR